MNKINPGCKFLKCILIIFISFFIVLNIADIIFAEEGDSPPPADTAGEAAEGKKDKKEQVIKFQSFSTASNLLLITDINIDEANGFGDIKIKNNSKANIILLYGRIIRYEEKEGGKRGNITVLNNHNKPPVILTDNVHKAGQEMVWRFSLMRSKLLEGPQYKYTINIDRRSIFFE